MPLRGPGALKKAMPPNWINFLVLGNTILLNLFMANGLGSKAECEEITAVQGKMLLGKPGSLVQASVIHLGVKTLDAS